MECTWYVLTSLYHPYLTLLFPSFHSLTLFFFPQYLSTIAPPLNYSPARTIGAHLWYIPYVTLTPSTCFVLDNGNGRVVGYCIGTSSTTHFTQRWLEEFIPTVDRSLVPPLDSDNDGGTSEEMQTEEIKHFRKAVYTADCSMLLPYKQDELNKYPAHFHIDILEAYQRKGWGTVLLKAFFEKVKQDGAKGVHLDMVKENHKARAFYERMGFGACQRVLDGGVSGEMGVNGIVLTLVKEL